ncbi:hypothetical protein [Vibrio sp. 10N.222.54.A3]|uniref:hypothetical protein n=1 Tax=Vibrio sp. 10N.222.54.A3 TaxID=3229633 RepID=UPI0035508C47
MKQNHDYIRSENELLNRASSVSSDDLVLALTSDMTKEQRRKKMRDARNALRAESQQTSNHHTVTSTRAHTLHGAMAAY